MEEEVVKVGGYVLFILGNYELMVLVNDFWYIKEKYKILVEKLKMEYFWLFGFDIELGRWLGICNIM